jgi:hypothetical protein
MTVLARPCTAMLARAAASLLSCWKRDQLNELERSYLTGVAHGDPQ